MKGMNMLMVCCAVVILWTVVSEAETLPLSSAPNEYPPSIHHRDFRSRRGFKNSGSLATARGFGKRSSAAPASDDSDEIAIDFDESYPLDWLVDYIQQKPALIRFLVERFFDRNGDGQVSTTEITDALSA